MGSTQLALGAVRGGLEARLAFPVRSEKIVRVQAASQAVASALAGSPQCRGCGPDYLMLAFVLVFSTALPWLAGTFIVFVVGLVMRAPWFEILLAPAAGSVLALALAVGLTAAVDTVGVNGLTAGVAALEVLWVVGWGIRWWRSRARRT